MNVARSLPQVQPSPALAVKRSIALSLAGSAVVAALLVATATAQAQGSAKAPAATAPASAATTLGEVRKIDRVQAVVTIKHGPITNLDMPAMTMAFKASDPKLLTGLKVGDKVRFAAVDANGTLTVTTIEAAK